MSRDAVIVSTARTPLTKAARGVFNNTTGATLGAYSIKAAVERAGLEGGEIDDVIMGCAVQQGSTGGNVARLAALRAGLPVSVPAMTIDRQCSS
ncbi:MAG: acetyl-CoA C-acyltransferase, partial [Novosphingobium sp.]